MLCKARPSIAQMFPADSSHETGGAALPGPGGVQKAPRVVRGGGQILKHFLYAFLIHIGRATTIVPRFDPNSAIHPKPSVPDIHLRVCAPPFPSPSSSSHTTLPCPPPHLPLPSPWPRSLSLSLSPPTMMFLRVVVGFDLIFEAYPYAVFLLLRNSVSFTGANISPHNASGHTLIKK